MNYPFALFLAIVVWMALRLFIEFFSPTKPNFQFLDLNDIQCTKKVLCLLSSEEHMILTHSSLKRQESQLDTLPDEWFLWLYDNEEGGEMGDEYQCVELEPKQKLTVTRLFNTDPVLGIPAVMEYTPPNTTLAHSSQIFVCSAPVGTPIPWEVLLGATDPGKCHVAGKGDASSSDDGSPNSLSSNSALSHFILLRYTSVPLHVHAPSTLTREALRVKESHRQSMCWIGNYCSLDDAIVQHQRWLLMDNNKLSKEVEVAMCKGAAVAAISSKPHWRKKGPMQWDVVLNTVR